MASLENGRHSDENVIEDPTCYQMNKLIKYNKLEYFNHDEPSLVLWHSRERSICMPPSVGKQNQRCKFRKSRIAIIVAIVLTLCSFIAAVVVAVHFSSTVSRRLTPADPCAVIVSRAGWNARETRSVTYMPVPVGLVFIHHTALDRCCNSNMCISEMQRIQNLHMDTNGWDDLGYSFVVGEDGMAYEARGWERVGAHTRGFNNVSISIAVMGNFDHVLPIESALQTINSVIQCGLRKRKILPDYKLYGHRDGSPNFNSPGHKLYNLIKTWSHYSNVPLVRH